MQMVNVALGGTLWQDIADERADSIKHDYYPTAGFPRDHLAHLVEIRSDSRLGEAMAGGPVPVNSMHHQGIRELSSRLVATAAAPDGLIEAAEASDDSFAVGVQWHPEMYANGEPSTGRLFDAFIAAARGESRLA